MENVLYLDNVGCASENSNKFVFSLGFHYICRDYLGSITHVANADGSLK